MLMRLIFKLLSADPQCTRCEDMANIVEEENLSHIRSMTTVSFGKLFRRCSNVVVLGGSRCTFFCVSLGAYQKNAALIWVSSKTCLTQTCNLSRMHGYYPFKILIFLGKFLL